MTLSRRTFLQGTGWAGLAGAATLGGAACSGGDTAAGKPALTFWYWDGGMSGDVVKRVSTTFADRAAITSAVIPGDFGQRLKTALSAGRSVPDVSGVKGEDMPVFVTQPEDFLDLNTLGAKEIAARFARAKYDQATSADGKQVGLPIDLGPTALFLRDDLWKQAGLPTDIAQVNGLMSTWEGWFDVGRRLRAKLPETFLVRNSSDVFGIALAQQPETFITRDGEFAGDRGGVKSAWDIAVRAITEGLQAGVYDDTQFGGALSAGTLTGHIGPAWNGLDIASAAPDTSGTWRVAACPGGPANIGGSYLTLPRTCREPKIAFEYVAGLLSPANQGEAFKDASLFPAVTAAYSLSALTEGQEFYGGQATIEVFGPAAENLPDVYEAPLNAAITASYYTELSNIEGGKDPAKAWVDAVDAGRQIHVESES